MSLLKLAELAQKKSELGNKINNVHDGITQSDSDKKLKAKSHFQKYFNQ